MHYSEELYQQTREEMSRLKSELKQYREWSASPDVNSFMQEIMIEISK